MEYDTTNEAGREAFAAMVAALQKAGAGFDLRVGRNGREGLVRIEPHGVGMISV